MVEYNLRTILGHIYGTSSLLHFGSRFICTRDLRALIPWWIVGLSLQQTKNWARFFYSCRWVVSTMFENFSKLWIFGLRFVISIRLVNSTHFRSLYKTKTNCTLCDYLHALISKRIKITYLARFARNVECDFFCDFKPLWIRFGQLKATRRGRRGDALTQVNAWTATHTICRRSFFFPFPSF